MDIYKIRAFRAVNDLESCRRFADGHANVLKEYGITKLTTSRTDWFYNEGVYVVLVESLDGEQIFGGERIHLATGRSRLPIEDAISIVDTRIFELVQKYQNGGKVTGELCGLWNSRAIAGRGLSILLTKIGVALARIIKMDSLFVLCAPYTVTMCQQAGFEIEKSIGNEGTFVYPKLDLIATSLIIKDLRSLPNANIDFKERIIDLAARPVQNANEIGPKGEFQVSFNLTI